MPIFTTLKSEKKFDSFIKSGNSAVIVYHFLCHGCQAYLEELKDRVDEFSDVGLARIHMTLNWVIKEAELYGDVEEENIFLRDRYDVGNLFPTTLFFNNGKLVRKVDGVLTPAQLRCVIDETFGEVDFRA
jgi:thiol-disulfide isomerase/thioredoxin